MDDFSVYRSSFESYLEILETVLQRCKDKNLDLNWEKCHFIVTEGIEYKRNGILAITPRIHDFLKIARPLCKLLEKDAKFAMGAVLGQRKEKIFRAIY